MSVRPAALDLQRERVEQPSAPPASSTPSQLARNDVSAPSQSRKRTAHKPRRAVVRRRGARVDSESEQDDLDPQRANVKSRDSDSESDDLELPSSDDEDSEEEDDDDGVAEPKTPATASVEQLPQSLDTATTPSRQPPKSCKAVLTGQVLHPSWSDMPAPGEDGDTSLPTLDFSNLSLDVVQHLPSPPPRSRPAVASTSRAAALSSAPVPQPQPQATTAAGGLTKKQLQEQKRQAKLAALKQKDPEAAERIEKERQERLAAKRLAKKERLKEKKRERKALEHAARDASAQPAPSQLEQDAAVPAAPPSASNDKPARPAKNARPVVPSRPSRTAVALGLLGPESPPLPPSATSSDRPAPALPPSASATTPVVPAATRQPAFLPRDSEGRPIVQSLPPTTRPRAHHQTDDDHAASQWVRGRGGAPRGFGSYRGGRGAARFAHQQDRDEVSAHSDAAEEDRGFRGRGRGRGALARGGGFAGRGGRGVVATGPPGSINPRYAHLPFHPLHRFPSPCPAPKSASPAPSNRSTGQASNVGPEVTTASPDEQLFEAEAGSSASAAAAQEKPTGVVKLPANGAAQIMMTVKGAAAAQAAWDHGASKENRAPAESVDAAATSEVEPHKLSDPGILYASAPRRPTEQEAADSSVATSSEAPREPLSLLHQVPPHLQASAGPPVVEQDAPVYYQQQQQPYSGPYWSSEVPEPYPISTPSPAPAPTDQQFGVPLAHPAPSSAYFVPPRPNKRVEIKNPSSRDGQSPAPPSTATKSAPPAPVDALEAAREIRDAQILQQQEHQRQAEASYMHAMNYSFQQQQQAPAPPSRPPFPSSPTFTRDGFPIPANAPLPPPSVDHQQAVLQPLHAPQMYTPYPPAHVMAQQQPQPQPPTTTTTYELVAPYPSHYPAAAAYYAPQQQPMYQPTLSPPVGLPAGYYGGMYGARPVVYEEQPLPQWTGY